MCCSHHCVLSVCTYYVFKAHRVVSCDTHKCVVLHRHVPSTFSMYVKALLCICMKNTAQGGVSRDKYSRRQSQMLYYLQLFLKWCVFQTDKLGGALIDIFPEAKI